MWKKLVIYCGLEYNADNKDLIKSKFQLYMNGNWIQNKSNPLYKYFNENHSNFTYYLFKIKDDEDFNLSNAINQIESDIIWDKSINDELKNKGLKYDIIHDCLWLYGDNVNIDTITESAKRIITEFQQRYDIQVVFTLELISKEKELIK
jgi:hypothetical protein